VTPRTPEWTVVRDRPRQSGVHHRQQQKIDRQRPYRIQRRRSTWRDQEMALTVHVSQTWVEQPEG
jgi:hypothetical protein